MAWLTLNFCARRHLKDFPMSLTLSQASVPVFTQTLTAMSACLDKAEAFCAAKKIDVLVLTGMRLAPDMLAFARQVQLSCDFAKNTSARLAGIDPPKFEDTEKTFVELKARIARTLAYIQSVGAKDIDAGAARDVTFPVGPEMKVTMKGQDYLLHFALPNFYFHSSIAYSILRHCGVELGKRDFMGAIPGFAPH